MVNARECCKCFTVSLVPVTVFCLAVVFFGGIIVLPTLFVELANYQQYGVVIDAGSSHTSFYLYEWYLPKSNSTGVVFETAVCPGDDFHYVTPAGISTFIRNTTKAGPSLVNCTMGIIGTAPKLIRPNITVFLGATAGMRLVEKWNHSVSDAILDSVNNSLSDTLKRNDFSGRTITGKEEATSAWVTVNYLGGYFDQKYPNRRERSLPSTIGSLDMGGASMQISFASTNPPMNYSDTITVFGYQHTLYSRSYLCYGYTEALRQVCANASLAQPNNGNVTFPCLPRDAVMIITRADLFGDNHYCTSGLNISQRNLDNNVTFVGTGNGTQCRQLIQQVMDFAKNSDPSVPPAAGKFTAFSAFYKTADVFNITNLNKTSIDKFENTMTSFCNSTLNETKAKASNAKPEYAMYYCFSGQYVLHVLKNGFGFNSTSVKEWSVDFADNITADGNTLDTRTIHYGWALGYMMLHTPDIPKSPSYQWRPYSVVDLVVGMLVLSILCFVFVVFFVFTCTACYRALRTNAAGYSNIA